MNEIAEKPLTRIAKGALADRWGRLKAQQDGIKVKIDALREEFDRRELIVAQGKSFLITKRSYSFTGVDNALVTAEPGWQAKFAKPMARTEHRVTPLAAAA